MSDHSLIINKFMLIGHRKNYVLPAFKRGINVIYGSSDTGKTMILKLISYCLGKTSISRPAPEVMENCSYIVLEISLCGEIITIKRDLHKKTAPIDVFFDTIDKINRNPDEQYHINGTKNLEKISNFILSKLKIPALKVPYAPNNPEKFNIISIKDILNLIYLDETEMGTADFLRRLNYHKHIKYMESLKAVFNIQNLDVQKLIKEQEFFSKQKRDLVRSIDEIKKFLIKNKILDEFDFSNKQQTIADTITKINTDLKNINYEIQNNSNNTSDLNNEILSQKEIISQINFDMKIIKTKLSDFQELVKTYSEKHEKKEAILELGPLVDDDEHECPFCKSLIDSEVNINTDLIKAEKQELSVKISDLNSVINQNKEILASLEKNQEKEISKLKYLEKEHAELYKYYLSPQMGKRDQLMMDLGKYQQSLEDLKNKNLLVIDYQKMIIDEQKNSKKIIELNKQINELNKTMKTQDEVIKQMSISYAEFLTFIEQKSAKYPYIDDKFVPHITITNTDTEFFKVPGTAKPVVLSVAYYTTLLKYAIENNTYLPNTLMLDGISKGRQTNPENPTDKIDIETYNKIYLYWKRLLEDNPEKSSQIIVVDNAKPPVELNENILIIFDKTGANNSRKGLIDDIN